MRLTDLVAACHDSFDPGLAMADLAAVCAHDRYQASAGIAAAASYVAERAQAAGLSEVSVLSFPADGAQRWWTYRSPLSWTPVRAGLAVNADTLVRYPEQPYALAAYSARVPLRRLPLLRWSAVRLGADPGGAVVVADESVALGALVGPLTAAGAVAVAADPLGGRADRDLGQAGRLELPPGGRLAAFGVTATQLAALVAAADAGAAATIEVVIDDDPRAMPVVTGLLPGNSDRGNTADRASVPSAAQRERQRFGRRRAARCRQGAHRACRARGGPRPCGGRRAWAGWKRRGWRRRRGCAGPGCGSCGVRSSQVSRPTCTRW